MTQLKPKPAPALLALDGVSKVYRNGTAEIRALDSVSLEIRAGEFVAIMGQSGSGKSTLMNIIGCLDRPSRGSYQVGGRDVADLSADELAALRRDTFGFVFQRYNLLATATAAIVVCGDLETAFDRQLSFLLQDCSAAIENLLLAAHALGLGACWVGVHPIEDAVKQLKQMLSLPTSVVPVAAIALGHPGEQPGPRTRFNPDHIHFEKW